MTEYQRIHEKAVQAAKNFHRAEAELLEIIQQVDKRKVFRALGFSSLFTYVTQSLGLSENLAYNFITVARKSNEIPQMKEAIESGTLNVSKARRVVSVINSDNQASWIEKASNLTQREVEKKVAEVQPQSRVKERIKVLTPSVSELRCPISEELGEKIKRVQDLESTRQKRAVTIEGAVEAMVEVYLEKKDPVAKAHKAKTREVKKLSSRKESQSQCLSASIKHEVNKRDGGRCIYVDRSGTRCSNRRWIQYHHVVPVSQGGEHRVENIISVCQVHHKAFHQGHISFNTLT